MVLFTLAPDLKGSSILENAEEVKFVVANSGR
jgi:hypothetical protein